MSYRFMRMIVFFDLPVGTSSEQRDYRQFRKFLIENGFLMMQESVYCKLLFNNTVRNTMTENIRKNKPSKGIVQVLTVTEKQFSKIDYIVGEWKSDIISSDERIVEL